MRLKQVKQQKQQCYSLEHSDKKKVLRQYGGSFGVKIWILHSFLIKILLQFKKVNVAMVSIKSSLTARNQLWWTCWRIKIQPYEMASQMVSSPHLKLLSPYAWQH